MRLHHRMVNFETPQVQLDGIVRKGLRSARFANLDSKTLLSSQSRTTGSVVGSEMWFPASHVAAMQHGPDSVAPVCRSGRSVAEGFHWSGGVFVASDR